MRIGRHRLAARRIAVGLTQEGLAERLDVAVSTVARWEQGATAPRAWQRGRLAEVLEVSLTELDELLAPDPASDDAAGVAAPGVPGDPRPPGAPGRSVAGGPGTAVVAPGEVVRAVVPRPPGFVGRVEAVAAVVEALDQHRVVAVVGRRGVGTSACAAEAVHVRGPRSGGSSSLAPGATFYSDLRRQPAARGAAPAWPPVVDEALATPGALLVVDNVDHPEAVRELLRRASSAGCRLLLVGPPDLGDLEAVHPVGLDDLTRAEAAALFEVASTRPEEGPVGTRDDPTVLELVERCGHQPRALVALAREIAAGPLDLEGSLEALRLAVQTPPHQPVRFLLAATTVAATDVAYQALSTGGRRLFRRLGLVAPQPVALEGMAKLAGWSGRSITQAERLVAELAHGRAVRPVPSVASAEAAEGGRYQVHPLLVTYARLHLRRDEPTWRRARAQVRLVRYLARKAERHTSRPSRAGREWFECHQPLLASLVATPMPQAVQRWWFRLAAALCRWYADERRLDDWWAACEAVEQAGRRRRHTLWVLNERGVILRRRGDHRGAIAELTRALPRRGRRGEAQVLTNRGLALLDLDAVDAALADLKRALRGRSPRDRVGLGLTEMGLGVAYLRSGAASDARRHLVKAADAFDRAGDLRGAAAARANLVLAEWETGAHQAAVEAGRVALDKYAALERLTGRADAAGVAAARHNLEVVESSVHR